MTQEKLHEYRKRAVGWLEYACAGNPGLDSPRHLEVKEHRKGKGYSSCGDLAHWLWYRLGVRLDFLNRAEHQGWTCGANVSRIVSQAVPYTGEKLEGGDVIVVANDWPRGRDAHVICIIDQPTAGELWTAESGLPGNGLQTRMLPMRRKIRVVLTLDHVLTEAERGGRLELCLFI